MLNPLPCLSWVSSRVLRNVMKILDDLREPLPRKCVKTYVFPRCICNFPRFRALLFVKRARSIVRNGWIQYGGTWPSKLAVDVVVTAGKLWFASAQGSELNSPSASLQLSIAQWCLEIRWKEERPQNIEMKTMFPKYMPDVNLSARGK